MVRLSEKLYVKIVRVSACMPRSSMSGMRPTMLLRSRVVMMDWFHTMMSCGRRRSRTSRKAGI